MIFGILSTLLVLITTIALLAPLFKAPGQVLDRKTAAIGILRNQLIEIEGDIDRGVLSLDDAENARTEIQRRILRLTDTGISGVQSKKFMRSDRLLPVTAALFVPLLAVAIYGWIGNPSLQSQSKEDRGIELQQIAEFSGLADDLKRRLQSNPNSPIQGWIMLSDAYAKLGRFTDAVSAIEQIVDRPDASAGVFTRYAELLITSENGIVTPKAEGLIDRVLTSDSKNIAAIYYKALALYQSGELKDAYALLASRIDIGGEPTSGIQALIAQANQIAGELGEPMIVSNAKESVGPGPTAEDVRAAGNLSAEEREVFVASMVERLATRLEENPNDLSGWLRLARSYGVLGNEEKQRSALESAQRLVADLEEGNEQKVAVQEALEQLDQK